jgi:hypothetical protein
MGRWRGFAEDEELDEAEEQYSQRKLAQEEGQKRVHSVAI